MNEKQPNNTCNAPGPAGTSYTYGATLTIPCEPAKMNLAGKRIIVMQSQYGAAAGIPMAVHDSLDNALADLGRRAADALIGHWDTSQHGLYLVAVDR